MNESIRVLHVDDEPDLAEVTAEFLERETDRFTIKTATSVAAGLERLSEDIDCLVSDYDIPDQNGIEFLRSVRETHPDLPFILFTGKGSEEIASDAISAGVTDYLQKGSGREQYTLLANRIENAVAQYRAEREVEVTERRYRRLIEESTDLITVVDDTGAFQYLSPAAERVLGYAVEDLLGEHGLEYVHPDDRETAIDHFTELIAHPERRLTTEFRFQHADGAWIWLEIRGRNLRADPTINGLVVYARNITERKQRERDLEQTNVLLSTLLDTLPVGILAEDSSRNVLTVNQRLFDLFEMPGTPNEVIGAACAQLAEDVSHMFTDPDLFVRRITELIGNREKGETERISLNDGRTFARSYQSIELTDGQGHLWVYRDVTDHQTHRRQLEALHETTRQLFQTDSHEEIAELTSTAAQEILDLPINSVHLYQADEHALISVASTPETTAQFGEIPRFAAGKGLAWDVFETGTAQVYDDVRTASGVHNPETEMRSELILPLGEYGIFMAGSTTIGEFTDRHISLAEVLAANVEVALRRIDHEQTITALHEIAVKVGTSETAVDVCERTIEAAEEILAFDQSLIALESDNRLHIAATSEALPPEEELSLPINEGIMGPVYRNGDSVRIDDLRTRGIADAPGRYQSAICISIGEHGVFLAVADERGAFDDDDLTLGELLVSHTANALDYLKRERVLERQNERLDEFTSVVSHDLRNPLTVAQGRLALAREECSSDHLADVATAHKRMRRLIDDLLELAQEGELVDASAEVKLATVIENCWQTVETAEATLVVETNRFAYADESRLKQLFKNLIRNAIEHGGPDVTVTVGDLPDGFYVEDNGPGIPASERDRIFDAGYSTIEEGTGFGLRIVRQIATAHGWEIAVTTGTAGGARFEIIIEDFEP